MLRLPHARGGVSFLSRSLPKRSTSSPRPWGCFPLVLLDKFRHKVFPTPVGVFPIVGTNGITRNSLPHARGGVSASPYSPSLTDESSPRPWGCFHGYIMSLLYVRVFPTPVGVFPSWPLASRVDISLPHARGGVSDEQAFRVRFRESSPRPWGCFHDKAAAVLSAFVFPTPVGVFPSLSWTVRPMWCLPHARGGVSVLDKAHGIRHASSPRPWGCFHYNKLPVNHLSVFPTPVGVFPDLIPPLPQRGSLPHARGGVSFCYPCLFHLGRSSPRPWGCFLKVSYIITGGTVFPTPVGVFLSFPAPKFRSLRLPHARGGVSFLRGGHLSPSKSSPRPWGCFHAFPRAFVFRRVFPTPVGVFLDT